MPLSVQCHAADTSEDPFPVLAVGDFLSPSMLCMHAPPMSIYAAQSGNIHAKAVLLPCTGVLKKECADEVSSNND